MALYDCECQDCHSRFEVKRSIKEDQPFYCPQCQGKARILLSPALVIYKGSGFYTTDSRGPSPKSEEPAVSGSSGKEPK